MASKFATFSSLFRRKKKAKGISVPSGPQHIRALTWNIQGSNRKALDARLEGIYEIIKKEQPHVVFLQDVVPHALEGLQAHLKDYQIVAGRGKSFVVTMLNTQVSEFEKNTTSPFFNTKTERSLMAVKCRIKGVSFWIMNGHLESGGDVSTQRKMQLKMSFQKMEDFDEDDTVIFAGDFGLFDHELDDMGGAPEGILDVWEMLGRQQETYATWDANANDNSKGAKGRGRFDRVYIRNRPVQPLLKPVLFELVGIERLGCNHFPSDHWGVLSYLQIQDYSSQSG